MRYIIYLLTLSTTLISFSSHAKPHRRTIERDRSHSHRNTHSPPRRRRVIKATPAVHNSPQRSLVSAKPHRSKVQRHRSQRRSSERAARLHRNAQSEQRRVERRQQRRVERRQQRRTERRQQRRTERRQRRQIPVYAFAPPIRFIVNHHPRPRHNDDRFFDELYHDGERYGINGDFRDEDQRIERGIQKGLITPIEASRLYRLLWDAYYLEDHCIADGYLTEEEEADLYWAERELNRSIRWEMRDFDTW